MEGRLRKWTVERRVSISVISAVTVTSIHVRKNSIYDDVLPRLDQWRADGKKIYIYSSGSVPAQKLLVGYSVKGNLLKV